MISPEIQMFLPAGLTALGGLVTLVTEPFLHGKAKHKVLPWIAVAFLVFSALTLFVAPDGLAYGVFGWDAVRLLLSAVILACTLLGIAGLQGSLARDQFSGGEPYALIMLASTGVQLMVMAVDLLALFVSMELASFSIYALVGLRRAHERSNEALFKYFVSGAIFSALFLYGAALTYGATGATHIGAPILEGRHWLYQAGLFFLVLGLLFKAGVAPLHFWVADVYTGVPVAVTGFMASVVKVGTFAALGTLWLGAITGSAGTEKVWNLGEKISVLPSVIMVRTGLLFLVAGIASVAIGAFTGLAQRSARRILAFSGITNAGLLLLGFVLPAFFAEGTVQLQAVWYFLIAYALGVAGALAGLSALSGPQDELDDLSGLRGMGRRYPLIGSTVTVCLASLAGLPPAAGFLAKFGLFSGIIYAGLWEIAVLTLVLSTFSAVYYLRIVYALWTPGESADNLTPLSASTLSLLKISLIAVAVTLFVLTVFPVL